VDIYVGIHFSVINGVVNRYDVYIQTASVVELEGLEELWQQRTSLTNSTRRPPHRWAG